MQDVGSKEDTELSSEDLTLSWRSCLFNPLDSVSLLEIGCFSREVSKNRRTQVYSPRLPSDILSNFPSLEEHPLRTVSVAWSVAEALNHSA